MGSPKQCESKALEECCKLLTFATENKTGLPSQIVADIQAAWDARDQSKWSPEVATKFWVAYDGLCSHLGRVTIDTLSASYDKVPSLFRRFGSKATTTLARRWAHIFLAFLLLLLVASMGVALITTSGEIVANEIDRQLEKGDKLVSEIQNIMSTRPDAIQPDTAFDSVALKPEDRKWAADLRAHIVSLFIVADILYEKSNASVFRWLMIKEYPSCPSWEDVEKIHCYYKGYIMQPGSLSNVLEQYADLYHYFDTQREVRQRVEQAKARLAGLKAYILPALLGMLGACTYVVRNISDQVKDFTFSRSSPLRHSLRVALGSIVGVVVVTFYGTPEAVKLSASAWAFIAGYAMEGVFAVFDNIVAKLK